MDYSREIEEARDRIKERDKQNRAAERLIADLKEKAAIEERMRRDATRLAELNKTPEERAKAEAAAMKEADTRRAEAEAKRRQEEASRPPHWPFPGPGMSKEQQSQWLDDHDL